MKRRAAWLAIGVGSLVLVGVGAAGRDAAGSTRDLLFGGTVTTATLVAFTAVVCWLALVATLGLATATLVGAGRQRRVLPVWTRMIVVVGLGGALLAGGIVTHSGGYRVCCENPTTVQQAEHLVH